jgi:hypothetical protein
MNGTDVKFFFSCLEGFLNIAVNLVHQHEGAPTVMANSRAFSIRDFIHDRWAFSAVQRSRSLVARILAGIKTGFGDHNIMLANIMFCRIMLECVSSIGPMIFNA